MAGPSEIGGFGAVRQIGPDRYEMYRIWVCTSSASSGHHDMDEVDIGVAMADAIEEVDDPKHLRLWWHTHGGNTAFVSSVDANAINEQTELGQKVVNVIFGDPSDVLARTDWRVAPGERGKRAEMMDFEWAVELPEEMEMIRRSTSLGTPHRVQQTRSYYQSGGYTVSPAGGGWTSWEPNSVGPVTDGDWADDISYWGIGLISNDHEEKLVLKVISDAYGCSEDVAAEYAKGMSDNELEYYVDLALPF